MHHGEITPFCQPQALAGRARGTALTNFCSLNGPQMLAWGPARSPAILRSKHIRANHAPDDVRHMPMGARTPQNRLLSLAAPDKAVCVLTNRRAAD